MKNITKSTNTKKNLPLLQWIIMLSQTTLHVPIWVIYFLDKWITLGQVAMLYTSFLVAQLIFEVPAGVIWDRYWQKTALVLWGLLNIFVLLWFIFFDSYILFAVAMGVSWIASSFKSGSDSSLLYETLVHQGIGDQFKKIYGKCTWWMFWWRAWWALIGGFLYTIFPELPFIADIVLQTIYTVLALFLTDSFVMRVKEWFQETRKSFKWSYHEAFTRKNFAKIFIFSALIGCIARVTLSQYVQPYLEFQMIDIVWFGAIFAAYNIISWIGSLYADRFGKLFTIDKYLILHAVLFGIFLSVLVTTSNIWITLLIFAVLFFLMGLYQPTVWAYVNDNVQSHNRTTMLSINSQLYTIGATVILFITWFASDSGGVTNVMYVLSIFSFVLLVVYVLTVRKVEVD
jgi:MFS family permease